MEKTLNIYIGNNATIATINTFEFGVCVALEDFAIKVTKPEQAIKSTSKYEKWNEYSDTRFNGGISPDLVITKERTNLYQTDTKIISYADVVDYIVSQSESYQAYNLTCGAGNLINILDQFNHLNREIRNIEIHGAHAGTIITKDNSNLEHRGF